MAEQIQLIRRLAERGQDTKLAEDLLRALKQTLEQWRAHRQLILDALARS